MLKLEQAARTDVGRKRSNNQDYLGDFLFRSGRRYGPEKLEERGHLYAVADGMGGYAGGEIASEVAITTLFDVYYNSPSSGDLANDLSNAIQQANFNVRGESVTSGRSQMGTTLTLVLLKGNRAIFGNVGDSRTYLIRHGAPIRVTHDHSLVQDQIDAGVLTPEQAERSSIRNFITRAIGHKEDVESDLFERELITGDVLLLCSDGLHGLVKETEMAQAVSMIPGLEDAAQKLIDLANERGGPDNISVLLVRVQEVGEPIPSVLNGREAVYESIYNRPTEQIAILTPPDETFAPPATSLHSADQPTTPNPDLLKTGSKSVTLSARENQPTRPMPAVSVPRKPGGNGLLIGIFLLFAIVALIVGVVIFLGSGSSNTAPAPTTIPAASPVAPSANSPAAPAPGSTRIASPPPIPTATPLVAATPTLTKSGRSDPPGGT